MTDIEQPLQQPERAGRMPGDAAFHRLDPRVVKLWRVTGAIGYGILLATLLPGVALAALLRPGTWLWLWLGVGWLALAALLAWLCFRYPLLAYRAWGYRIDERVLETRHGVWFQVSQFLPLTRLQHVDLRRGPVERQFGLARLVLHTAGTHAASIEIPGLDADEAARLRLQLTETGGGDAV
jgi:uncharacterized protein